jgi:hypothetical protein
MKEIFEDFFNFIFPKYSDSNDEIELKKDDSFSFKLFSIILLAIVCIFSWILLKS